MMSLTRSKELQPTTPKQDDITFRLDNGHIEARGQVTGTVTFIQIHILVTQRTATGGQLPTALHAMESGGATLPAIKPFLNYCGGRTAPATDLTGNT